jgi:hypothetical protein
LELIGKAAGMFGDTASVDVNVSATVVVEHERRLTLGDLADFARQLDGPGGRDLEGVPVAGELVAAPLEGVVAAGGDAARRPA